MPAKPSFSTRLLRPAATFLSTLNEYFLSLTVAFRPFYGTGKRWILNCGWICTIVLPLPYLRDLIDLQLTLSDEENGFAEGVHPNPNACWTAACTRL